MEIVVEIIGYEENSAADLQFLPEDLDISPAKKTAAAVSGFGPGIRKVQVEAVHRAVGQVLEDRFGRPVDNPGVGQLSLLDLSLSFQTAFFLYLQPDEQAGGVHSAVLDQEVTVSTADLHFELLE